MQPYRRILWSRILDAVRPAREGIKFVRRCRFPGLCSRWRGNGPANLLVEMRSMDRGGLEEMVFTLLRNLDKNKFRPVIACVERGGLVAERAASLGIPVYLLNGSIQEYQRVLKEERIDLVNSHYSMFGASLTKAAGISNIYVLHNSYLWLGHIRSAQLSWNMRNVDQFIAVSSTVAEYAKKRFMPRANIEVIANGFDSDRIDLKNREGLRKRTRQDLGLDDSAQLLLLTGSYEPRKGHRALLEAFSRIAHKFPQAILVCVGAIFYQDYFKECKQKVIDLGLEKRVKLIDFSQNIGNYYAAADFFVLPSVVEGFSLSTLEAAAYGLPVILTDTGGARDILRIYSAGKLVPGYLPDLTIASRREIEEVERNPPVSVVDGLARAMEEMVGDAGRWRDLGRAGVGEVIREFDARVVARKYEEIFSRFLNAQLNQ